MPPTPSAWEYRLAVLDDRVAKIEQLQPAVIAHQVGQLREEIASVRDDIAGVRRALIGWGLSVAGSAVVFAFTAFQIFGRP